jgi:hypothetical protein
MNVKEEGALFPPVPVPTRRLREQQQQRPRAAVVGGGPPCEMCGTPVIATHCRRICTRCGFMTGCSEGI